MCQSSILLRYFRENNSATVREMIFISEKEYAPPEVGTYITLSSALNCQKPICDIELSEERAPLLILVRFKNIFGKEISPIKEHRTWAQMLR